jgi:hypothetical protein
MDNLLVLDYLIYSSHKTSTQSLKSTFDLNGYKSIHCHSFNDLNYLFPIIDNKQCKIDRDIFIDTLTKYKEINGKKLKIISIIRNPLQRCISSFFQSFHTDEINYDKKLSEETTISTNNIEDLFIIYEKLIRDKTLPGIYESLDEISNIFNINIIDNLESKENHYYFHNDLIELYVLDFKKMIENDNFNYINDCLNINLTASSCENLSINKLYYEKYITMKNNISENCKQNIEEIYNKFYFSAFR